MNKILEKAKFDLPSTSKRSSICELVSYAGFLIFKVKFVKRRFLEK